MTHFAKGPFKGKGEHKNDWRLKSLRNNVEQLQTELKKTVKTMRSLIEDYDKTFTGTLTAYLAFHKTANGSYVRWRMNGVKQRYFAIANDEIGETFLRTQSITVRKVLLDFEQHRIRLNLLHALCFYEAKSLEKLIENTKRTNALARER